MLRFMGSQSVGHDWATELNGTEEPTIERKTLQNFEQFLMKEYLFFQLRYC